MQEVLSLSPNTRPTPLHKQKDALNKIYKYE